MNRGVKNILKASHDVVNDLINDDVLQKNILEIVGIMADTFRRGGKVLLCGNGGSAADAQHIAAELSGKFYIDRDPLDAEALHVNTSYLTAVANDYSFDEVFSRLVKAKGKKGDILVGITTSGNSKNILAALKQAKEIGLITLGLTGSSAGAVDEYCDFLIKVPSKDTPRVQEAHILTGHIICQLVESELFS